MRFRKSVLCGALCAAMAANLVAASPVAAVPAPTGFYVIIGEGASPDQAVLSLAEQHPELRADIEQVLRGQVDAGTLNLFSTSVITAIDLLESRPSTADIIPTDLSVSSMRLPLATAQAPSGVTPLSTIGGTFTKTGELTLKALYCEVIAGCQEVSRTTFFFTVDQGFNSIRANTKSNNSAWTGKVAGGVCFKSNGLGCGQGTWSTASGYTTQFTTQKPSANGGYWSIRYIASYPPAGSSTSDSVSWTFKCDMADAVCKWQ